MKRKIALILTMVFLCSLAIYSVASVFFSPRLVFEQEPQGWEYVKAKAAARGDAFHLGDAIPYVVTIEYNLEMIERIDTKSLDKNVVLQPLAIKSREDREFSRGKNVRVFVREYTVQLLDGEVNKLYPFPSIVLRYKMRDGSWFDKTMAPEPIFIAGRMPADVTGLTLKPLKGKLLNMNFQRLPWILRGVGFLFGVLALFEVFRKLRNYRKATKEYQKKMKGLEDLYRAHKALCQKATAGETMSLKEILNQAHQILRALLSRKAGVDWLDPDLDKIDGVIRPKISEILAICQKAYQYDPPTREETNGVLEKLEQVFNFYLERGR